MNEQSAVNAVGLGIVPESQLLETPQAEEAPVEKPARVEKEEVKIEDMEVQARGYQEEKIAEPEDEIEDKMDPEDRKNVEDVVKKSLTPTEARVKAMNDEIAINTFVMEHPEFAKYKPAVKKYIEHPAYKYVPVDMVAKALAFDDAMTLGAERERAAQKKAAETRTPGSAIRSDMGEKSVWSLSQAEFDKKVAAMKQNARNNRY